VVGDDASDLENSFVSWVASVIELMNVVNSNISNVEINQQNSKKKLGKKNIVKPPVAVVQSNKVEVSDEEEEEDRINSKFVLMDSDSDCDDGEAHASNTFRGIEDENTAIEATSGSILDLEDLAKATSGGGATSIATASTSAPREMVTRLQRRALTKEGYKIIGSHSAVKLCRWTKNQLRGRGGCYKHSFYGITSYQCMEATPSLACANKCVFCWR